MKLILFLITILLTLSCGSESQENENATLDFRVQTQDSSSLYEQFVSPFSSITHPSQLACIFFNVTGPNIAPSDPHDFNSGPDSPKYGETLNGKPCSYAGASSPLILNQNGSSASVTVPTGIRRLVQVMGLAPSTTISCPSTEPASKVIRDTELQTGTNISRMYELGRKMVDVFDDTTLSIPNQLTSENAYLKNQDSCNNSGNRILPAYVRYGTAATTNVPVSFPNSTPPTYSGIRNDWTDANAANYGLQNTITAAEASSLVDNNTSTFLAAPKTTSYTTRIDILFPYNASLHDAKPKLRVAFSCSNTNNPLYFAAWNTTPEWTTVVNNNAITSVSWHEEDYGGASHNLYMSDLATQVTTSAGVNQDFVYFSFRTTDNCETLRLHEVSLEHY